ncbi:L,D-transpeptidase [Gordonia humi]|uniref:Lipoprotein-anchoring transpeptidase ErfK/SrfK n=1 Tax=Gordonia humi TaxID=686429 RepID=A0A840EVM4_9ACTN|nr:Ig-like domain-containing protein [Gordonia humi]MBB4134373.1 lipoprotein-anchoring transpeptidase ErfK/SrfK [Gordonia humi]
MTTQDNTSRRAFLSAVGIGALGLVAAACGTDSTADDAPKDPAARLTYAPAVGADGVSPVDKISVTVSDGTLGRDVALVNAAGKKVKGELSTDKTTFIVGEPLGYGGTYTWKGTAIGDDGRRVPLAGSITTLTPDQQINVVVNIADGQEVGIAAPLILQFDGTIEDKAAVEKVLTVTTTPHTEGSWAWLGEDNGSRAHWRPKEYWAPGTKVHMDAKLYGVAMGEGAYGADDVTSDFTIGRSQIVKADASSHQIVVVRDGATLMTLPCSYGEGDLDRNVTRSGIHVVSEKYEQFNMTNPEAGYFNIPERWAVRISNNGEFIHANPETLGVQGASNVTNGCINLSLEGAQQYFETAVYGDPVEVTGTRIEMSEADGDIYDWIFGWEQWTSMSALGGEPKTKDVPATPKGAPTPASKSKSAR